MTPWHDLKQSVDALSPHVLPLALICTRLVPVAFLCPLFGGAATPTHVKLGLVLALATFLHAAAGIDVPHASNLEAFGLATKECVLGFTLGLIASLPFDTARIGGRFIDLFRGSSAEAAVPLAGTKEAATGDALYHVLLALAATGAAMPLWLSSMLRSFAWVRPGVFVPSESVALQAATLVGTAIATGLAIGAPVAALSLAIDGMVGLASRAAPSMNLPEVATPLRILGGGCVTWLSVGLIAERFLALGSGMSDSLRLLMELGRG